MQAVLRFAGSPLKLEAKQNVLQGDLGHVLETPVCDKPALINRTGICHCEHLEQQIAITLAQNGRGKALDFQGIKH